jgi:hypothetical protein
LNLRWALQTAPVFKTHCMAAQAIVRCLRFIMLLSGAGRATSIATSALSLTSVQMSPAAGTVVRFASATGQANGAAINAGAAAKASIMTGLAHASSVGRGGLANTFSIAGEAVPVNVALTALVSGCLDLRTEGLGVHSDAGVRQDVSALCDTRCEVSGRPRGGDGGDCDRLAQESGRPSCPPTPYVRFAHAAVREAS